MNDADRHAYFAADWLSLREPVDHAARAESLTAAAADWLAGQADATYRIIDLGAGRGSNLRYLAPRLPARQHWCLLDHDRGLLDSTRAEADRCTDANGAPVTIETRTLDLASADLEAALDGAKLVSAAALFDLVTQDWIERLARACARRGAAVLFVLSIDGHIDLAPAHADDAVVFDLLAAHQQRDKQFGAALGKRAPAVLRQAFEARGYTVTRRSSPWQIDRARAELGAALIEGWRSAACEQAPQAAARIDDWAKARIRALRRGELAMTVGHEDMFATPGS
ncbi:hypothetical protein T5B8_01940 [Salinisphaera sp. T5B8]|uniref:class I SAM-dependent methyltransferase n=1 Tax=Salinisphaera sp. T5B8 TaxID=1304154 RepID=UPI00333EB636